MALMIHYSPRLMPVHIGIVDPVIVLVVLVEAEFEINVLANDQAYRDAHGQSENNNGSVHAIGKEIPEDDFKVTLEHWLGFILMKLKVDEGQLTT
jgi:hypothetical protein